MALVDDKGRIFGIINIFDLAILCFVLILVASLFLYTKFPPQIKEHRPVVFQMYFGTILFKDGNYYPLSEEAGEEIFVPGTELVATYEKLDKAVIIAADKVTDTRGEIGFLVTMNASLEVDVDGDILFNGNDVAPGNIHNVQVGNSYLQGVIWSVDSERRKGVVIVKINTTALYDNKMLPGDLVFDRLDNEIGIVINHTGIAGEEEHYTTLSLRADVYDEGYFVSEIYLQPSNFIYFFVKDQEYYSHIIEVYP